MKTKMAIMCLDVYLSSLREKDSTIQLPNIEIPDSASPPLHCWDVYSTQYEMDRARARKQADIRNLYALTESINPEFDYGFIYSREYSALVLTSQLQVIQWVSPGFYKMTGYPKKYAVGRTLKFLQGPNTSHFARQRIKTKLEEDGSFKEILLNYKADNSEYLCEIEIFPIPNPEGVTKVYLAVENELM